MAADPINIVNTLRAVQYDGTNSGDIVALDEFNFNNDSEVNGVWSFQSPPDSASFVVQTGDWILFAQNQVMYRTSNPEFEITYSCNALCPEVEQLAFMALAPKVQAVGIAAVPTLLSNMGVTVVVTLQPAMADATYSAYAHKFAGVAVDNLNITSVTVVDEDTVHVDVHNAGSTLTGANLLVHAVA